MAKADQHFLYKVPAGSTRGKQPMEKTTEYALYVSGIRGKKLWCLLAVVCVLGAFAIALLVCNIVILKSLQMTSHGMAAMQFVRTENVSILQFLSAKVALPFVRAAMIGGFKHQNLSMIGRSISIANLSASSANVKPLIEIRDGAVKMRGKEGFGVANTALQSVFNAAAPILTLPKHIKRMAAKQIIANRVCSPFNETFTIAAENLSFRGNEGNHLTANNIDFLIGGNIQLETSDSGKIRLHAGRSTTIGSVSSLQISTSPHLSADILAYRLCACENTGRLFLVEGNKKCLLQPAQCY